ncbi:hypothetical protein ACQ4PT_058473 [Festuca glaucescens]
MRAKRGAVSVRSLRRSDLMTHDKVPGYIKQSHETTVPRVGELTEKGRRVIDSAKNLICLMHEKKLTLNGNFSEKNLACLSSVKQVKFKRISEDDFDELTPEAGDKDFEALAQTIEHILERCNLPYDLLDWLLLLKTVPLDNPFLVKHHISLKSHQEKVSYYIYLFGLLEQLKELADQGDPDSKKKYEAVLKAVHAGNTTENKNWRANVFCNIYLKDVYHFKRKEYTQTANALGLILFSRHCTQHLMAKSVKNGKVMFKYKDMLWMIEAAIPGLFHQFQIAMVDQGLEGFAD